MDVYLLRTKGNDCFSLSRKRLRNDHGYAKVAQLTSICSRAEEKKNNQKQPFFQYMCLFRYDISTHTCYHERQADTTEWWTIEAKM
jgi:hypothetical protein